jgi:tripartite-type tricarboxylate transporter receptor subunit TctC
MKKIVIFGAAAAMAAGALPAQAASGADFYRGRSISMLVGYGAGTGYDVYARALVRHYERHIPGGPKFIVKNMPGASSLKMLNYLANVSKRDGSELGAPARGLFFEPLFGNKKAQFDPVAFTFIGSIGKATPLCFTWHTSGITGIDQAKTRTVVVGATGGPSNSNIYPRILNGILGTKFKIISGYKGSGAIGLAMERGEVEGYCSFGWASIKSARSNWIEKKQINILLQISLKPHPELAKVPLVMDLVKKKEDRQALELSFAQSEMARPIVGPRDVPKDRAEVLRAAFVATMKDKKFLSDATKNAIEIDPISGEEVRALIARVYATPRDIVARVMKMRPKMK